MLCDNCNENESSVKYTQIINGQKKQMNLCEKCSNALGIDHIDFNLPIDFSSFLGDFLNGYNENMLLPNVIQTEEPKCVSCGLTYNDFIESGKFGCAECYNSFPDKIDYILNKLHGSNIHTGKKIKKENRIENKKILNETTVGKKAVKPKVNVKEEKTDDKKIVLENLKEDLRIAIKEERYEEAAKIRDKIKDLEIGGQKDE